MEVSLTTPHYTTALSTSVAGNRRSSAVKPSNFLPLSLNSPPPQPSSSSSSSDSSTNPSSPSPPLSRHLRRPKTLKTTTAKTPSNPLRTLSKPGILAPTSNGGDSGSLTRKLWLTSKLSPPPPPPPLTEIAIESDEEESEAEEEKVVEENSTRNVEFRQQGKIFVGNLPGWIKKNDVAEFFRQFGPVKSVILIRAHESAERNAGFGFVIYGGAGAERSAMKAVEFDGVEFHGRVLTVKLDDGRRLKGKMEGRARWVGGGEGDGAEHRSKWHEERDGSRREFRRVVETEPENWQAVVQAFQRIKKPARKEYGLMVKYYARRGDMHRARETFESMRARGIEPSSHVFSR